MAARGTQGGTDGGDRWRRRLWRGLVVAFAATVLLAGWIGFRLATIDRRTQAQIVADIPLLTNAEIEAILVEALGLDGSQGERPLSLGEPRRLRVVLQQTYLGNNLEYVSRSGHPEYSPSPRGQFEDHALAVVMQPFEAKVKSYGQFIWVNNPKDADVRIAIDVRPRKTTNQVDELPPSLPAGVNTGTMQPERFLVHEAPWSRAIVAIGGDGILGGTLELAHSSGIAIQEIIARATFPTAGSIEDVRGMFVLPQEFTDAQHVLADTRLLVAAGSHRKEWWYGNGDSCGGEPNCPWTWLSACIQPFWRAVAVERTLRGLAAFHGVGRLKPITAGETSKQLQTRALVERSLMPLADGFRERVTDRLSEMALGIRLDPAYYNAPDIKSAMSIVHASIVDRSAEFERMQRDLKGELLAAQTCKFVNDYESRKLTLRTLILGGESHAGAE